MITGEEGLIPPSPNGAKSQLLGGAHGAAAARKLVVEAAVGSACTADPAPVVTAAFITRGMGAETSFGSDAIGVASEAADVSAPVSPFKGVVTGSERPRKHPQNHIGSFASSNS